MKPLIDLQYTLKAHKASYSPEKHLTDLQNTLVNLSKQVKI
jgi:hypothetical protein